MQLIGYLCCFYAHAVVLNDVLLALGYISKYVFCMPVDYHFVDNHVVNLFFSKQLKKWVLFDAAQIYDMETATKHIEIYTSDAEKFWSNPEENENDAKIIKL